MQTVFSPLHARHGGNVELMPGEIVPAFEKPERAEMIRARVEEVGLGPVLAPEPHGLDAATRVHAPDYVDFLARAWPLWAAAGRGGTAMPFVWPVPGLRADVVPADIDGLLGYYAMDAGATFVEGTWEAVKASHDVALTAAALVAGGAPAAFALCRRRGTMPAPAPPAATAISTTLQWRPSGCAGGARRGSRYSTSTIITATGRRRSSTAAATCRW